MDYKMLLERYPLSIFGSSIGYSFSCYLSSIVADNNVKMLEVDGVCPNAGNIKNSTYPITTSFYVVYRKDTLNLNVHKLVE